MGAGVGLRPAHLQIFMEEKPKSVTWLEVISENYMAWQNRSLGHSHEFLLQLRKDYDFALHGVSLSIGSVDEVDMNYMKRLKELVDLIHPRAVSDHLCWTTFNGKNSHDLLPVPYDEDTLNWIVNKIDQVQNFLGRPILLENPSSYLEYKSSTMTEWDFLAQMSKKSGCGLLLDINNVYVSSVNHRFNAKTYLQNIPHDQVGQIHLAGHSNNGDHLIDTHDEDVCDEVWGLYHWYIKNYGRVGTMIERDGNIPEWSVLEKEILKIQGVENESATISL